MDSNPPENIRGHPFPGNGTHKKLLHCWWGYQSVKLLKEDNLVISIKIRNAYTYPLTKNSGKCLEVYPTDIYIYVLNYERERKEYQTT